VNLEGFARLAVIERDSPNIKVQNQKRGAMRHDLKPLGEQYHGGTKLD
jgi:hypothetical protein